MRYIYLVPGFLFILLTGTVSAQKKTLKQDISSIAADAKGKVGVALLNLETGETLNYNADSSMVMQSVFKFPIAVAVLNLIDRGKFRLNQPVHITKADLPENYSPLRDKYPNGNIDLPISELLSYMISLSDNDACDILLNKVCSKAKTERYMRKLGLKDIDIRARESEMKANWNAQYTDVAKPTDLLRLLQITYTGDALSETSKAFLWKIMTATSTAPKRIKGLLPAGTIVAHKSGTSATNTNTGVTPATNDMGIITLPNGHHLALVILVCEAKANTEARELVIARIARAAYDAYNE
jgi:beta-lactamase class A